MKIAPEHPEFFDAGLRPGRAKADIRFGKRTIDLQGGRRRGAHGWTHQHPPWPLDRSLVTRARHLRRVRRRAAAIAIGAIVFILGMPFAFGYGAVASGRIADLPRFGTIDRTV